MQPTCGTESRTPKLSAESDGTMRLVETVLKWLYQIEAVVAATAYGVLSATILIDVIAREVFSYPILGTQRFAVYMAIISGFLGVGLAAAVGGHIRPRVAEKWLPAAWNPQVNRASNLLASLVFGVTAFYAVEFWKSGYAMGDTAPVLNWPLWPIKLFIPYAFGSTAFRYLMYAVFPGVSPETKK